MIDFSKWTVPPEQIAVMVFAYPDEMISCQASMWLRRFPEENIFHNNIQFIEVARNATVKEWTIRLNKRFTHVLFIDKDMRPSEASDHFLTQDYDIAGCRYDLGNPLAWQYPTAVHMGLCRISRDVFIKLTPPWFMFPFAEDRCRVLTCECCYFLEKAVAAGFTAGSTGWAEHKPNGSCRA